MPSDLTPQSSRPANGFAEAPSRAFLSGSRSGPIAVSSLTIRDYCAAPGQLVLPWSQRSYAWGTEQMEQIFHDVYLRSSSQKWPNYSLGHVSLALDAGPLGLNLIDGNQRTTSIMILLSVVRDLTADLVAQNDFDALIWRRKADADADPKFSIHQNSAAFFARAVLDRGATLVAIEESPDLLETEKRILRNRDVAVKRMSTLAPSALARFAGYLLDSCWLVCTSVATSDEAWEMLKSEETRGLSHHQTDVHKIRLIAAMPREQQEEATTIWHRCQERLGRDSMADLLTIIRMIEGKGPALSSKPLDVEIIELCALHRDGLPFMIEKVEPRADKLARLKSLDLDAGVATAAVCRHVRTLSWLEQPFWWTPALRWMEERGLDHPETADFFFRLDRTAWMNRLGSPDPINLQRRAAAIARDVGEPGPVRDWKSLEIATKLEEEALTTLNSRTFEEKSVSPLVLRRLSFELSKRAHPEREDAACDLGPVDRVTTTTEHILPRSKPKPGTEWARQFVNMEGMRASAFRLGNLAFLSGYDNGRCADSDFGVKVKIFAGSEHVLANEAGRYKTWTKDVILQRTEMLIDVLWDVWRLK